MGYIIEVSFDILKNSNMTEIQVEVKNLAEYYGCVSFYEDYEYDDRCQYKRNHCVFTTHFLDENMLFMLDFIKNIRKEKYLFLESIYNEESRMLVYASQYYLTQMDKYKAKMFRRERSYSEDEAMIIKTIKK
jgi:hypothetical protein